jgi:signal transduction histidine kinase
VETADPLKLGLPDALEGIQAAANELARLRGVDEVAKGALASALTLTRSSIAFIGLAGDSGVFERLYSRTADGSGSPPDTEIERMITGPESSSTAAICRQPLYADGRTIGTIGVTRSLPYTDIDCQAFAFFAMQVGSSIQIERLRHGRQETVGALVDLFSDIERARKDRLLAAVETQSSDKVDRAHELSVEALLAISVLARTGRTIGEFHERLTASIAQLVGAARVLFWRVDNGKLRAIPGGFGVDREFTSRFNPVPCEPERDDLQSRVVFKDHVFLAGARGESPESDYVLDVLGVADAISVPWRAGDQRLGLLAAYDSTRPEGFTREDSYVLQKAGLAAGLVWQLKLAEGDLKETVKRLEKVDAARQLLLKTVSTAIDNERKRFANELHDDALQTLTAAELQLQRIAESDGAQQSMVVEMQSLLGRTEDALRRLLFEVRPPALETAGGLEQSIRDRLGILRSLTGIQAEIEIGIPDGLSYEFKSMVFRQLTEAITNIEKHAGATKVEVRLVDKDGGVYGLVADNGRGFVVAERNNLPGHLGLLALKERALMAGGWYKVESEPGLGTRIEFWMPIA